MRVWFNGRISASQADGGGSIPLTRFRENSPIGEDRGTVALTPDRKAKLTYQP